MLTHTTTGLRPPHSKGGDAVTQGLRRHRERNPLLGGKQTFAVFGIHDALGRHPGKTGRRCARRYLIYDSGVDGCDGRAHVVMMTNKHAYRRKFNFSKVRIICHSFEGKQSTSTFAM